jgi:sRNA-binding protein
MTMNMMMRQDHTHVIRLLAQTYPKTFFVEPRRRVPLKHAIEQDIKADLVNNSELCFFNIEDAVDWYRSHIGYQMACSMPGNGRLDLTGATVAKVTEAEARVAQQAVDQIHQAMGRYKPSSSPAPERATPLAPPSLKIFTVDSSLNNAEMLAAIERHVKSLVAIVVGELVVDDTLRANLARPVLRLIIDELKTVEARLG